MKLSRVRTSLIDFAVSADEWLYVILMGLINGFKKWVRWMKCKRGEHSWGSFSSQIVRCSRCPCWKINKEDTIGPGFANVVRENGGTSYGIQDTDRYWNIGSIITYDGDIIRAAQQQLTEQQRATNQVLRDAAIYGSGLAVSRLGNDGEGPTADTSGSRGSVLQGITGTFVP